LAGDTTPTNSHGNLFQLQRKIAPQSTREEYLGLGDLEAGMIYIRSALKPVAYVTRMDLAERETHGMSHIDISSTSW